jgi:uncharacterized membrane protein
MAYKYWVLLHLLGVLGLLGTHGVSIFALYRIRALVPDRQRIAETVAFSGSTVIPMYVSLAALLVGGVGAAIKGQYLRETWIELSILILVVVLVGMYALARPYFQRITAACAMRSSGVPRTSDEELAELVRGPRAHVISAIGTVGLVAIVALMVFKPGLGT